MSDNEEIQKLKEQIEQLEKQLKENKEGDEKRHQEIKELQKSQHEDDMKWKKIGVFTTPASIIAGLLALWKLLKNGKGASGKKSGDDKSAAATDNFPKSDLAGIIEIIKEVKK